jgi:hypothetical protein
MVWLQVTQASVVGDFTLPYFLDQLPLSRDKLDSNYQRASNSYVTPNLIREIQH